MQHRKKDGFLTLERFLFVVSNHPLNQLFFFISVFGVRRVNKYKLLICASTNAIYTFDTYIILFLLLHSHS